MDRTLKILPPPPPQQHLLRSQSAIETGISTSSPSLITPILPELEYIDWKPVFDQLKLECPHTCIPCDTKELSRYLKVYRKETNRDAYLEHQKLIQVYAKTCILCNIML